MTSGNRRETEEVLSDFRDSWLLGTTDIVSKRNEKDFALYFFNCILYIMHITMMTNKWHF